LTGPVRERPVDVSREKPVDVSGKKPVDVSGKKPVDVSENCQQVGLQFSGPYPVSPDR
jgi:hypothetical protein